MESKIEHDWGAFNGISTGSTHNTLPVQTLPESKKKKSWRKACMDRLERIGREQLRENSKFADYRKMKNGEFTYSAVGLSQDFEMPWFDKEVRKLREKQNIPTYLKHFDFIGIVVNALSGIYGEFEDRFVIDSRDEYSTNEYIRQKTEMLHKYAQQVFMQEINKLLLMRGIDPAKQDFQSEEEAQAYQQTIQQNVQALTPPEIEQSLSKNFKVIATEWAQNVLEEDKVRFRIPDLDAENFVEYCLSGRYFKHFRVGYDTYYIENWRMEEVFFSQDVDARFPQEGEFVGRVTEMAPSNLLNRFGHLMTTKQQEGIGNYWNQTHKYDEMNGAQIETSNKPIEQSAFGEPVVTPFHNYFDHKVNEQMEDALGVPLGKTTIKGQDGDDITFDSWIPRLDEPDYDGGIYTEYLRDDINVRRDTVRVTEAYWRSYKRLGVLISENETGSLSVDLTTDDLISDYLKEEEIKKLRNISLQDLQQALKDNNLEDYVNTITYIYVPEVWQGIKIRGNGTTVEKDMYLDVRPLDYQIKGSGSNIYDVRLPVAGIIDTGLAVKLAPYQQLHNICMNQITELLEKELGVFFAFDITGFPSEYQDDTTEEAIFRARDIIKDTGLLGLDLSRQNTAGNQPNIFQRHEVVYATQVQYRWQLAQQYKQEALSQIGLTPQMLGQPNTYTTAEGVKQGAQASYALINPIFDRMSLAKAKEIELHIAVAQYCQVNDKDQTKMFRKGDGELRFLDIMAEDGELFPLRNLGVLPISSSKDRKIVQDLQQFIMNDNTIAKDFQDALDILTNPTIVELKQVAGEIRKRTDKKTQEQRDFESQQLQQQIQSAEKQTEDLQQHEVMIEAMKIQGRLKEAEIQSLGRLNDNQSVNYDLMDRISKVAQDDTQNQLRDREIVAKENEVTSKETDRAENRKIELQKLALKAEELRQKKEKIQADKTIAFVNKN